MIDLTEIFCSIQGESAKAGLPCIFIRFAGCNLRCSYCDTTDSYTKRFSLENTEILQRIKKYDPLKIVEITGGEPLIQKDVYQLLPLLNVAGYEVLLETNGSVSLAEVPGYVTKIVDVKCPGSKEQDSFLLSNIMYLNPADELKFVLTDEEDYLFARKFLQDNELPVMNIHFSPVERFLAPRTLANWIIRDRLPVRLQLQIHRYIWGDEPEGDLILRNN